MSRLFALLALAGTALFTPAMEVVADPPDRGGAFTADEIVAHSQRAFYFAGSDMRAKVVMDLVTESGKRRTRVLTMLRRNGPGNEEQRYFLYFHEPGDVRRTAFLVWKYPEKDDDRWIFIPALNAVRRVAASDSRSSFVGSDFTYEDISGRDLSADAHALLREEKLGEADCFVIESIPKQPTEYTRRLSWIDERTFLPMKEEYYDKRGDLARVFTADQLAEIPGSAAGGGGPYPTVTKRTMTNVKSGHRTEVAFLNTAYDVGLGDDAFTERALQAPSQRWIE